MAKTLLALLALLAFPSVTQAGDMVNIDCGALETIAKVDAEPWVKFSFYPCPVGDPTVKGCQKETAPNLIQCCIHDKFEDCMVDVLGCDDPARNCTLDTRLKMAKFLGCYEGGHIEEATCTQDAKNCSTYAGLPYADIQACFTNETRVYNAAIKMQNACTAAHPQFWPHILINDAPAGGSDCHGDSCFIPILPRLCAAYKGSPKPKSCSMLDKFKW